MEKEITLRAATPKDAQTLLEIYRPYVINTPITFEYVLPSEEEFVRRMESTLEKYPYLVAEKDGVAVGYAYAGTFKPRAAYDWAVETSIYVDIGEQGLHVGRRLYEALEAILRAQNIENLNACITDCDESASIPFHERMGYRTVARFTKCGYKLGQWWDMVWMEKHIGSHNIPPEPFIPFPEIADKIRL